MGRPRTLFWGWGLDGLSPVGVACVGKGSNWTQKRRESDMRPSQLAIGWFSMLQGTPPMASRGSERRWELEVAPNTPPSLCLIQTGSEPHPPGGPCPFPPGPGVRPRHRVTLTSRCTTSTVVSLPLREERRWPTKDSISPISFRSSWKASSVGVRSPTSSSCSRRLAFCSLASYHARRCPYSWSCRGEEAKTPKWGEGVRPHLV